MWWHNPTFSHFSQTIHHLPLLLISPLNSPPQWPVWTQRMRFTRIFSDSPPSLLTFLFSPYFTITWRGGTLHSILHIFLLSGWVETRWFLLLDFFVLDVSTVCLAIRNRSALLFDMDFECGERYVGLYMIMVMGISNIQLDANVDYV